jgi:hypothetical protein
MTRNNHLCWLQQKYLAHLVKFPKSDCSNILEFDSYSMYMDIGFAAVAAAAFQH